MPEAAQRQPKLRASCDRCGSAKLKCDRQHPACDRCQLLDLECVYGISRKSNRKAIRVRPTELPRPSATMQAANPSQGQQQNHRYREPESSRASVTSDLSSILEQSMIPDFSGGGMSNPHDSVALPTLEQFGSMDIDDWDFTEAMHNNFMESLPAPLLTPGSREIPIQTQLEAMIPPSHGAQHTHDCHREACAVFGSLSFLDLDQSPSGHGGTGGLAYLSNQVPLDHVLKLNRDACDGLLRLLRCSCARSPHLALLYTSIFSRVLIWYQQAVGIVHPISGVSAATSQQTSASASAASSAMSSRSGSAESISSGHTSAGSASSWRSERKRTLSIPALAHAVAPMQIAMGSFHIDDQNIQATMNIQLVSSEMRRAVAVIDAFAAQSSSGHSTAEACSFGGIDSLYRTLSAWLRGEHARTAGIIRSKLKDLSDANLPSSETHESDR